MAFNYTDKVLGPYRENIFVPPKKQKFVYNGPTIRPYENTKTDFFWKNCKISLIGTSLYRTRTIYLILDLDVNLALLLAAANHSEVFP